MQGWAIPGFGQQYYTGQKYAKLYNTLYQYYTKSNQLILSVKQQHTVIFESNRILKVCKIIMCLMRCSIRYIILLTL